ncbi:hypothetical protein E4U27_003132 [Claviceps purpurea]|nr:hypothetical protein E4U51_001607 [Claviceps purpurea]KAG6179640.1 hypothetical protein E4U27_003132 [Claviceps purpurea]KAG6304091.1 hypothetical protein E4U45_001900 [Claviceps purpurea]
MASTTSQASHFWHQALKLRKHLLRQIGKLQTEKTSGVDLSQFVAVESLLEKFRLAFVRTIFLDFPWAVKENAEEALWSLHTSINSEYRRIQGRLKHTSHAVERRKIEKSYHNFLRVAQKFYKGYIQRLTARYDVPELRRIARGIDAQQMEGIDQISPVPAELRKMVSKSCYSTLLRMGDLSRYRTQARHKNSGFETALTYYGLAHQLDPESGHAYHQMGIVHLDQGNHLDVVYYFYRSWAVESSHPLANANLEAEFKSLSLSKDRLNASDTQDAFSMWFVKLHALFYKGENFPQQAELEGEIMHRLEMACHSEQSTVTLLKMALINIAAHHVASTNYAESQTPAASRFYQFTLRFNAMFISHFCATVEVELKEAASVEESGTTSGTCAKFTPAAQALLPVLRIYSMWLAAHRQEIRAGVEAFGGVVPAMVQKLANVFTLLCVFSCSQEGLATCPYLLSEDLGIQGFIPLSEDRVPEACRCFCSGDGAPKAYLEEPSSQLKPAQESTARVLDILRCAYFLAEDATLPMSYRVADSLLIFEYSPEASSTLPAATSTPATSRVRSHEEKTGLDNSGRKSRANVDSSHNNSNHSSSNRKASSDSTSNDNKNINNVDSNINKRSDKRQKSNGNKSNSNNNKSNDKERNSTKNNNSKTVKIKTENIKINNANPNEKPNNNNDTNTGNKRSSETRTAHETENVFEPPVAPEKAEQANKATSHRMHEQTDIDPRSSLDDSLQVQESTEDEAESRVFDMLAPFLKPPTPQPHQQQGRSSAESSYGMHTATANEILGSFSTGPSPTSSVPLGDPSGKYAQLPWAWFNTPKPDDAVGGLSPSGRDAFSAQPSPYDSPRNLFATGTLLDDPFATPGRTHYGAVTNGMAAPQSRGNYGSPASLVELTDHKNSLLQAFSATNIPRSSPFTQWAENQSSMEYSEGLLSRQSRVHDHATAAAASHQAIGTSSFSHPSSLYQGTPTNAVGLGLGTAGGQFVPADLAMGEHAGQYYHIDHAASSYNDTIMQGAYYGNK